MIWFGGVGYKYWLFFLFLQYFVFILHIMLNLTLHFLENWNRLIETYLMVLEDELSCLQEKDSLKSKTEKIQKFGAETVDFQD